MKKQIAFLNYYFYMIAGIAPLSLVFFLVVIINQNISDSICIPVKQVTSFSFIYFFPSVLYINYKYDNL